MPGKDAEAHANPDRRARDDDDQAKDVARGLANFNAV
jgi:hypothetical protein